MNNSCPHCGSVYSGIGPQHVGRPFSCKKCAASLIVGPSGLETHASSTGTSGQPLPAPVASQPPAPLQDLSGLASPGSTVLIDFLVFRRMLVPILIQVLFWAGVVLCIVGASLLIYLSNTLLGLVLLFLGPLMVRIYCELVMVIFRINETLTDIKNELQRNPR